MTQEEKARAYDEALERARKLYNDAKANEYKSDMEDYESIFPELAESEDERIRKVIYILMLGMRKEIFTTQDEIVTKEKVLAYLEKQKDLDKMIVVSPEVWDNAITDAYENGKRDSEKQKEQKHPNGCFTCDEYKKGYEEGRRNGFTAGYNKAMKEVEQKEQKPAEWSEEDEDNLCRVIRVLEDNDSDWKELSNWLKSLRPQPKQEWSEEDDAYRIEAVKLLENPSLYESCPNLRQETIEWLKQLPKVSVNSEQVSVNSEWSEKDEEMIKRVIERIEAEIQYGDALTMAYGNQEIDWLKSLRPSWKPNDEDEVSKK